MSLTQTGSRVRAPGVPHGPTTSATARNTTRAAGLALAIAGLAVVGLASIAVGARSMPIATALHDLIHGGTTTDAVIVRSLRLPRTLLGLAAGAALGLAGALMQALTRNPLADPGLLGVNAGAAAAVVTGLGVLHLTNPAAYVWLALGGAGLAATVVYLLGTSGRSAATPTRLVLAGAAVTALLGAYVTALVLGDQGTLDDYRFWVVGSLAGRDLAVLARTGPFLLAGAVLALGLARPLNALALGDDTGRSLGAHVGRTRVLGVLAVTVLCGAATATIGPIAFVGLVVPHLARAVGGSDLRWLLPYALVLAPTLLLGADVLGRIVAPPAEVQVGIVTAFLGAPVFVLLARGRRTVAR